MVTLFKWNDSFLTHLPSVDEQHQRLVALVNDLGALVMSGEAVQPEAFAAMCDAIFDYTKVHFSDEESRMVEMRLDPCHLRMHSHEHHSFLDEAKRLGEIEGDVPPERASTLLDYLVNWLVCHILGTDQSMARQVLAIQDGLSPDQAFEEDTRYMASAVDPLLAATRELFHLVSERNRELRVLNRELDRRVEQRTVELEQANRQLQLLSTRDDLTGLPNRRFALSAIKQLWLEYERYGNLFAVLMLDADGFKQVNDHFGHAKGDDLLRALATQLRGVVRRSDIVCRLGGDEFLVICPRTSRAGAAAVAKKIVARKKPFFTADGVECWSGDISIGIGEAESAINKPEDLLQAADEALYAAKRQSRARIGGI